MAFITDMTEHKKALALAGEVQKSLLPQDKPLVQGLDIAGKNVSCDEIGGDYFDFLWRRDTQKGPFSVVVGDISGHGVDSALLMTTARAFLRMRASQPGTMSEIVTAMNRHLTRDVLETGRFMTLFYMTIDPGNNRLDWVRAGHDPAVMYDPVRDEFEELKGSGVALGVNETFDYEENYWKGLADGQVIAIGTDGIWEAVNRKGEMFGKERFRDIIRKNAKAGSVDILNAVYSELSRFTEGQKSEDDITLVIIKIDGIKKPS
jgi:sigma-B regulation protein RsbU (phosphoserine phosphatase)